MSFITQIDQVLHHATSASDDRQISTSTLFNISGDFSTSLFKQLLLNAQKNCSASLKGRRHNEIIKKFSLSLFLTIGPSPYELLHVNMPEAIPSLSTVEREANRRYSLLGEGQFIFDKLLAHLEGYNAEKIVSISEDATRIISRVEYDSSSNKIVGFVLPLDSNSLPEQTSFYATSFVDIEQMFLNSKKPLVHISTWCNPCQSAYRHFA